MDVSAVDPTLATGGIVTILGSLIVWLVKKNSEITKSHSDSLATFTKAIDGLSGTMGGVQRSTEANTEATKAGKASNDALVGTINLLLKRVLK